MQVLTHGTERTSLPRLPRVTWQGVVSPYLGPSESCLAMGATPKRLTIGTVWAVEMNTASEAGPGSC